MGMRSTEENSHLSAENRKECGMELILIQLQIGARQSAQAEALLNQLTSLVKVCDAEVVNRNMRVNVSFELSMVVFQMNLCNHIHILVRRV